MDENMKTKLKISNIVILGLVSLFIDMSTEMVYPLIPLYLTAVLGATPFIVGIIEGIAECIASLLKVFSGYIGDIRQNKKKLVFTGYSGSVIYKVLLLIAASWVGVLVARVVDRIGKGIRTAPRDALVVQTCDKNRLGGSFGLHKMLDMAGSSLGALIAFLFVLNGVAFQSAYLYSIFPAIMGICLIFFIKEKKSYTPSENKLRFKGVKLSRRLKIYLGVMFIFCIGNSSNVFLLLKAQECGFSTSEVILLYLIFNISVSVIAIPSGKLSDRCGRSRVIVPGYIIYSLVYMGFALLVSKISVIILFAAYGAYTAFISGAERAFIVEASPENFKGTVLGLYGMLQGIGLLLASIIAGTLWNQINSDAPFIFGSVVGIVSAALIGYLLLKEKSNQKGNF